ncbi:hypothetical protein [Chitinibacter sp. S2-10]|uniref:hypothetical protein n=1 Tax=Chitinibacter sp. S2-10 TaxID=3373597 RepID=UPI003977436B
MKIQALSKAEQSYLIRLISDLESGHARQWYWLEIAQSLPAAQKTRKATTMGIAIKVLGINACSPILHKMQLKGIGLYQRSGIKFTAFFKQKVSDALLFSGCLLALLQGFHRLPASLQFATWCLALGGAFWHLWQEFRSSQSTNNASILESDELPGAEASLGLPSIMLAAGVKAETSLQLVKGLKYDPDAVIAPLIQALPSIEPDADPSSKQKYLLAGFPWLVLGGINSWLIGVAPEYWGSVFALAMMAGLAYFTHRQRHTWLIMTGSWLSCFALASLVHYI